MSKLFSFFLFFLLANSAFVQDRIITPLSHFSINQAPFEGCIGIDLDTNKLVPKGRYEMSDGQLIYYEEFECRVFSNGRYEMWRVDNVYGISLHYKQAEICYNSKWHELKEIFPAGELSSYIDSNGAETMHFTVPLITNEKEYWRTTNHHFMWKNGTLIAWWIQSNLC